MSTPDISETEMSEFETGVSIMLKAIREYHFVAGELLRIAGGDDALDALEIPDDSFATLPPSWAMDPFNDNNASKCASCLAWTTVVRPGKTQCDLCADGAPILLARIILKRVQDESNLVKLEDVQSLIDQG